MEEPLSSSRIAPLTYSSQRWNLNQKITVAVNNFCEAAILFFSQADFQLCCGFSFLTGFTRSNAEATKLVLWKVNLFLQRFGQIKQESLKTSVGCRHRLNLFKRVHHSRVVLSAKRSADFGVAVFR